ncbi:MAG: plastocyanin/azurin family copper-binding protein [Marmoricola sp.]
MNRPTTTRRVHRATGLLAAALVALAGAVLGAAPARAASHHVDMEQYMFMPAATTIAQGDTVTWTNHDTAEHDVVVTSGPASFSSPMLAQGKSWSHTFATPGHYSYVCSVHPGMTASLTVTAAAVPPRAQAGATPNGTAHGTANGTANGATQAGTHTAPAGVPATPVRTATRSHATRTAKTSPAGSHAEADPGAASATTRTAPAASATLQPLILVVGASVVAMVFCLLLMVSRPLAGLEDVTSDASAGRRRLEDA